MSNEPKKNDRKLTVSQLADSIADFHVDQAPAPFDESVETVVRQLGRHLTAEQLADAIIEARGLCAEHGLMTWKVNGGSVLYRSGGTDETREHDRTTANRLFAEWSNS